jgi:hypothetical protein
VAGGCCKAGVHSARLKVGEEGAIAWLICKGTCSVQDGSSSVLSSSNEEVVTPGMQRLLEDLQGGKRASLAEGITLGG